MQAYDQDIFRHIGVAPEKQKILALKSTCHFRADFDPIAEKTLVVLAPMSIPFRMVMMDGVRHFM